MLTDIANNSLKMYSCTYGYEFRRVIAHSRRNFRTSSPQFAGGGGRPGGRPGEIVR